MARQSVNALYALTWFLRFRVKFLGGITWECWWPGIFRLLMALSHVQSLCRTKKVAVPKKKMNFLFGSFNHPWVHVDARLIASSPELNIQQLLLFQGAPWPLDQRAHQLLCFKTRQRVDDLMWLEGPTRYIQEEWHMIFGTIGLIGCRWCRLKFMQFLKGCHLAWARI